MEFQDFRFAVFTQEVSILRILHRGLRTRETFLSVIALRTFDTLHFEPYGALQCAHQQTAISSLWKVVQHTMCSLESCFLSAGKCVIATAHHLPGLPMACRHFRRASHRPHSHSPTRLAPTTSSYLQCGVQLLCQRHSYFNKWELDISFPYNVSTNCRCRSCLATTQKALQS